MNDMENFKDEDYIKRLKERYKKSSSKKSEEKESEEINKIEDEEVDKQESLEVIDVSNTPIEQDTNGEDPNKENENKELLDDQTQDKKKKNVFRLLFKAFPYISVVFWYSLGLIGIVYLVDNYLVEPYVHERPILEMPDLEGMDFDEAVQILENKKLRYELLIEQYNRRFKKNQVIRQKPEAGKLVREGRPVYLTKSLGSEKILAPNVKGMPFRQARVKIINEGLKVGSIVYKHSEIFPLDTVISQSIEKGSKLQYGDKIDLVVSKGSENMLLVPDLIYKDIEEAEDIIVEFDLRLGVITYIEDETYQNGTIIGQFPPSGEQVLRNSYIDLEVIQNPK